VKANRKLIESSLPKQLKVIQLHYEEDLLVKGIEVVEWGRSKNRPS